MKQHLLFLGMTDFQFFLLQYFLPLVLVCSVIEAIYFHVQSKFDWSSMLVSLSDLFGRLLVQYFLPLTLAAPVLYWAESHKLNLLVMDGWLSLLALFVFKISVTTGCTELVTVSVGFGVTMPFTIPPMS